MFAVAGGGIQNFEILYKFLNSDKAKYSLYDINVQSMYPQSYIKSMTRHYLIFP